MPQKVILEKQAIVQKISVATFNIISIYLSHSDKKPPLIPKKR